VNVLDGSGTNGIWRLDLKTNIGAPAQLGVDDVTNLVGSVVMISDATTNVYLETVIPRQFVPSPAALSYTRRPCSFFRSHPAPTPRSGAGQIDGARGTSQLQVRTRHLSAGNAYCIFLLPPSFSSSGLRLKHRIWSMRFCRKWIQARASDSWGWPAHQWRGQNRPTLRRRHRKPRQLWRQRICAVSFRSGLPAFPPAASDRVKSGPTAILRLSSAPAIITLS